MNCQEYFDSIGLLLDNELPADKQAPLFAHLSTCNACRDNFDILLLARSLMHDDQPAYPPDLDERILGRLWPALPPTVPRTSAPLRSRFIRVPLPVAAAAIILITALAVTLGRGLFSRPNDHAEGSATLVQQPAVEILYAIPGVDVVATASLDTTKTH